MKDALVFLKSFYHMLPNDENIQMTSSVLCQDVWKSQMNIDKKQSEPTIFSINIKQ